MALYGFEVYSRAGALVADLSTLATNRKITIERNAPEKITFEVDSRELSEYASTNNTTGAQILSAGVNEVRVKRNAPTGATYLCGGRIDYVETSGSGVDKTVNVTVNGFLNMFKDRFYEVQKVHTGVEASTILWTAINESQTASANFYAPTLPSAANCDFGVTQGTLDTIGNKDRTYEVGKNVKDILVQMTELQTTATDIYFTYDKTFNAVVRQGSDRPGIVFETGKNIIDYKLPIDSQEISNRVITTGSGTEGGGTLVQSIVTDSNSQINYRVRQHVQQFNSISEETTLSDHGNGYLQATKDPLNTPEVSVLLGDDLNVTDFWVGDRVTVNITESDLLDDPSGFYKIEQIQLDISDEDEESAKLTLSV